MDESNAAILVRRLGRLLRDYTNEDVKQTFYDLAEAIEAQPPHAHEWRWAESLGTGAVLTERCLCGAIRWRDKVYVPEE